MKETLRPGATKTKRLAVDKDRTIGFMGEEGRVYGTPYLVGDIERTCRELLLDHADAGEDSVGMEVALRHLAPTLLGMEVEITAKVVGGRRPQGDVRDRRQGRARADRDQHAHALRRRCRQDARAPEGEGRQARRRPYRMKRGGVMAAGPRRDRTVSTYCYQCVAGPDLLTVRIEDGVATEINPNFDAARVHPAGGKACVKAFGLVQKAYNPNRVLRPMKRTNPRKGRGEDPGFVPISWDEALDLVADKLNAARAAGLGRRVRLSARRRELRRRRHADRLHGHVPGIPRRLGRGRHELRQRPGREVLSLRASLRRAVASRLHGLARHAAVRLPRVVRRQCRGVGRRVRRQAPRRRAQARHEARRRSSRISR